MASHDYSDCRYTDRLATLTLFFAMLSTDQTFCRVQKEGHCVVTSESIHSSHKFSVCTKHALPRQ